MAERRLQGRRILVAEDEYLLADDMRQALEAAGATVLGPVASTGAALAAASAEARIDGAILDVNLGGRTVFAVADQLAERGVPFVFATGYDAGAIPARHAAIPRIEKPVLPEAVVPLLARTLRQAARRGR